MDLKSVFGRRSTVRIFTSKKWLDKRLQLYHHAHKEYDRAKQITLAYGEANVKLTANMSAMLAVHHLTNVMNDYLRMGLREDADRKCGCCWKRGAKVPRRRCTSTR